MNFEESTAGANALIMSGDDDRPTKIRRTARACLQCRSRKQRCNGPTNGPQGPCQRCQQLETTCSFQTDMAPGPTLAASPTNMAQMLVDLMQRVNAQEARISQLEKSTTASYSLGPSPSSDTLVPSLQGQPIALPSPPHDFNMNTLDLGPPIATLRSLGALSAEGSTNRSGQCSFPSTSPTYITKLSPYDPVLNGVITKEDAQRAVDLYFEHCHCMAPVLDQRLQNGTALQEVSPRLFLAVCTIGSRFWNDVASPANIPMSPGRGLHPRFINLMALLDKAIAHMLLQPTPADVCLESIRVLLLYVQWMPFRSETAGASSNFKSRYNDVSAWAVLGLALRYAAFLRLERAALSPFQGPPEAVTDDDISRMRVWNNLVTCDCNLMLSSGLPASLNPATTVATNRIFCQHPKAQRPADLRVTALVELAAIAHRAFNTEPNRQLDAVPLKKANVELDEWERYWSERLRTTAAQHVLLPFTSLRMYRLTINSSCLGPLLSSSSQLQSQAFQLHLLQSLDICLTAAAQTIFSLSTGGADAVWRLQAHDPSTFPVGLWSLDPNALSRIYYSVDSTWISLAFAVTFLILCYVRGTIDDDLQICSLTPPNGTRNCSPLPARSISNLGRLIKLAVAVFDSIGQMSSAHPARDFQQLVHNASKLILLDSQEEISHVPEDPDLALQSLFDLMTDAGLDWPNNFLSGERELTPGWGGFLS